MKEERIKEMKRQKIEDLKKQILIYKARQERDINFRRRFCSNPNHKHSYGQFENQEKGRRHNFY